MPIFNEKNGKLKKLKTLSIAKEKEVQTLVEKNLLEVLDMYFLATEYTTTFGGRIDTLAVDSNGAPVIIEYKRNKNDNVINQGLSYLKWLQAQKVEFFERLVIKTLGKEFFDHIKIDWNNTRVICIAESYSKFDIDTVEVIPLRIELFKYRYYEDGIFSLEPLGLSEQKSKSDISSGIAKAAVDFTVEHHIKKGSEKMREFFSELRSKIFEIDENIKEKSTTLSITYRISKNFAEIYIGKNQLKIHLRPIDYIDPENMVEQVSESYNWTMDRRVYIKNRDDIDYVFDLINQSYRDIL